MTVGARDHTIAGERSPGDVVAFKASRIIFSADDTKPAARSVAGRFGDRLLFAPTISANDERVGIIVIVATWLELKAAPILFTTFLASRPIGPKPFQGQLTATLSIDRDLIHRRLPWLDDNTIDLLEWFTAR